jgi:hypothetical protein
VPPEAVEDINLQYCNIRILNFASLPSAGLPFVLTQKEAKSQEASKSCPTDHSAVSARAREACTSEKPSFSLPKLQTFRLGYGAFLKILSLIFTEEPCPYEAKYRILNSG